ncbi:DUF11 domain-containing protein [Chloroflexus sp.]|uniref:DUF11 domain-containing protein n=1 Tax=Chloroflexus sp. TaxID=1904827 RepID=UPI002ACDD7B9|nr:DUF11 domain-containing protein [Chloroflexus sp.]
MRHVVWRLLLIVLGGAFLLIALLSSPPVMVGATPPLNITETSTAEPPTRTPTNTPVVPPTNTPTGTPVVPPTDTPTPALPPESPGSQPDLVLNKTVAPSVVRVGDQVVYTLTLNNIGGAPAIDVTIDDPLPAFLRLIDAGVSSGAAQTAGNRVTVVVPVVAPGEVVTITIRAEVVVEPLPPDNRNVAVARSGTTEITTDNNTSSTTVLPPVPDLTLAKSVSPAVARISDQVVYTLTIGNIGGAPATDITLTDTLPASLRLLGVTTTTGTASASGNQVTVTAPSLAPGETIIVQVTAQVVAPLVAPNNVNTASVSTSDREITTDNNTSSATLGSPPSSLPQTAGNPVRPFLSLIGLALVIIGLGTLLQRRSYR